MSLVTAYNDIYFTITECVHVLNTIVRVLHENVHLILTTYDEGNIIFIILRMRKMRL